MAYIREVRFDACERYFEVDVLPVVWKKIELCFAEYWQERTALEMEVEESRRKKYDYMLNMQHGIQGCDAMMFGLKGMVKQMCSRGKIDCGLGNGH